MKKIPLSQGKVALVDDVDYDRLVAMGKWCINSKGYAVRFLHFKKPFGKRYREIIRMHRVIMDCPDGVFVDHINGNPLDNRKANLRICSNSENLRNRKIARNNSSGFKGVHWRKDVRKWRSRIALDNKQKHLGYFDCPLQAAHAYNQAAIQHYGEFARLNEIPT